MIISNFTSKKSQFQNAIFFLLIIGLLIYTTSRATLLSLTCDEASTYFSHVPNSIWSCFFSESCWVDANNHLLNTFFIQISVSLFGLSEWTLRLPNVIGHLIYLIFSIFLVHRYSKNFWLRLTGLCLINLNPFLLEFFSLARGYGLGIGWMMMSIYFLFRWIENGKLTLGVYCYCSAFLAVLSNFIFLNYWASVTVIFGLFVLEKYIFERNRMSKKYILKSSLLPILASFILFIVLKNPIAYLQKKGEFVYGAESLMDSYSGMVQVSLMNQGYFNPFTTNVFILLSLCLLIFSMFFGVFSFVKNRDDNFSKIHFTVIGLTTLMILAMVVQYHLLEVKYLVGRKSIMLLPFFGLSVYFLLEYLYRKNSKKWSIGLAILISIFSFNHFYRTFDLKETIEWNYDAYTKNMIQYLEKNVDQSEKINLGVYWIYGPASEFYQIQFSTDKINEVIRLKDKDFDKLDNFDFIYLQPNQIGLINEQYILEKEFGKSGVLFKKKK